MLVEVKRMQCRVKVFDEEHEKDLEQAMNTFLKTIAETQLIDIKYQVAVSCDEVEGQIYCFSALVLYRA